MALWVPRFTSSPRISRAWTLPFALAVAAALAAGVMDVRGVLALLACAVACRAANRAVALRLRVIAHVLMLLVCGGLMLHVVPGFSNPLLLDSEVVSPGGVPYTQYLNFDKAVAGVLLLGVYAPELPGRDEGGRRLSSFAPRFAILAAVMVVASTGAGYVRLDPKMPSWFLTWLWSMVFFTALPEEALFRGVVQAGLTRLRGTTAGLVAGAVLFGLAHAAGGTTYVVLATVAGAGYGWIYAATGSIGAAVVAHTLLNTAHLLLFSYPALAAPQLLSPW